ncbi:MAG: outer membrane beta-barrel protein [Pseudomonadota bacterium]
MLNPLRVLLIAAVAPLAVLTHALAQSAAPAPANSADRDTRGVPNIDGLAPEGGWYLRIDAGGSRLNNGVATIGPRAQTYGGPGWTAGVGLGYRFSGQFRADVSADLVSHSRLQEKIFLTNLYWDLFTFGRATPYVGVGVGAAQVAIMSSAPVAAAVSGLDRYEWQAAWSLMAGTSWALGRDLTLTAGYRYIDLGAPSFDVKARPVEVNLSGLQEQQFRIGLRYALR